MVHWVGFDSLPWGKSQFLTFNIMAKRGFTVMDIQQMKFDVLPFEGEWLEKLGTPEKNFKAIWYGPSGSGKSVDTLKLAAYLTKFGTVAFNSHEQRISSSLQKNINKFIPDAPSTLKFYDSLSYEEMLQKKRVHFWFIDSIQYMKFTYAQYQDFVEKRPNVSLILIGQINGKGRVKGGTDILHAVDIKVNVVAGVAEYRSRFLDTGYASIKLFSPKQPKKVQTINQLPFAND